MFYKLGSGCWFHAALPAAALFFQSGPRTFVQTAFTISSSELRSAWVIRRISGRSIFSAGSFVAIDSPTLLAWLFVEECMSKFRSSCYLGQHGKRACSSFLFPRLLCFIFKRKRSR